MNLDMDGKKIMAVSWPDSGNETGRSWRVGYTGCDGLFLSAKHHGDRDEFWVVQMKGGEEVARHNARYIETIEWA